VALPQSPLEKLTALPIPCSWIEVGLLLRKGRRGGKGRRGKGIEGRDGDPQGLVHTPYVRNPENTLFGAKK